LDVYTKTYSIVAINQSINFYGGLNNNQLPQGPRKEKINLEDKARIGEREKMQF